MRSVERVILHVDMDAFYAAVEVRDDPALAGLPLIIGYPGGRGVVSTCSYEAREYGVRSAMPSVVARRLCPHATWRRGRMAHYVAISREIRKILDRYSPLVEPLSIDEAFVDRSGIDRDLRDGEATARGIRRAIVTEQGLTASVGVAPNKFLAKVASDLDKPDGLVVLSRESIPDRLWPLPVARLWGVGPRMDERLRRGGIRTIAELLRVPAADLARLVGEHAAAHLRALAEGRDDRPVHRSRRARSISEERTYGRDLTDPRQIDRALLARAEGVGRQLRRQGLVARTVHLKVRDGRYRTWTRSLTLAAPTDLAETLVDAARRLFAERIRIGRHGVRLLGVGVSGLETAGRGQAELFVDPAEQRARRAAQASDAVRDRLGERALTRARLLARREHDEGEAEPPEASSLPTVD